MFSVARRNLGLSIAVFSLMALFTMAQEQGPTRNAANIPTKLSGGQMFLSYCAPCHGKDAKGGGPMAPALKATPSDLTTLSKRNNGKFPTDYFATEGL